MLWLKIQNSYVFLTVSMSWTKESEENNAKKVGQRRNRESIGEK